MLPQGDSLDRSHSALLCSVLFCFGGWVDFVFVWFWFFGFLFLFLFSFPFIFSHRFLPCNSGLELHMYTKLTLNSPARSKNTCHHTQLSALLCNSRNVLVLGGLEREPRQCEWTYSTLGFREHFKLGLFSMI